MATNNAVSFNQLKKSVFNMKNYVDRSFPDGDKYINERFVEKDIDTKTPEYQTSTSNGNLQYIYNFDISNKHSDTMAAKYELIMNNTNDKYTSTIKSIDNYETGTLAISLTAMFIYDNSTNKEIGMVYVGLRAKKIVDAEGKLQTTTQLYDSAFIQFARSTTQMSNDINNVFLNGFKLKVTFYDISNNYAGDMYHIPYNLKNGSGSTLYQETCEVKSDVTNATVLGYKSVSNTGNSVNVGYRCTANGTGIIVGADSTINSNASYLFGTGSTINRMYGMAVGIGLNVPAANSNKGSMIIGVGGTLATDSSFAISTAKIKKNSSDCTDIRYPFEVKTNNDVYLRGSNLILETDNEPTANNHLINKKYVDDKVAGIVDSAPETLDTLQELATALGNDPNFATTVVTKIGKKVDKVEGMSLTHNDLTNELKTNYDAAYDYSQAKHSYNDLIDKPTIPSIDGLATESYVDSKTSMENVIYEGNGTGPDVISDYWTGCPVSSGNGCWVINKQIEFDSSKPNPYYLLCDNTLYSPENSTFDATNSAWIYPKVYNTGTIFICNKYNGENKLVLPWDNANSPSKMKLYTKTELATVIYDGDLEATSDEVKAMLVNVLGGDYSGKKN